jgi:hypothetical protein
MQTLAKAIARRRFTIWFLLFAVTTSVLATGPIARADEAYPSRAIRLIVPFPPGGPTDVMGRLISQALSGQLGQQVYVDNLAGAGSTLASKIAANAEPDGYTLLLAAPRRLRSGRRFIAMSNTIRNALSRSRWWPKCLTSWWRARRLRSGALPN